MDEHNVSSNCAVLTLVMFGLARLKCCYYKTKISLRLESSKLCVSAGVYSEIYVNLKSRSSVVNAQLLLRNSVSVDFEQTQTRAVSVATAEQTVVRCIQLNTFDGNQNFWKKWSKIQRKY